MEFSVYKNDPEFKVEEQSNNEETQDLQCPQCELSFQCILNLDNHIRFHTKEHPYECSKCHKSFPYRKDLQKHVKYFGSCMNIIECFTRSNAKDKTEDPGTAGETFCAECDKTFASQYGLLRHRRIHTGERPFECVECVKKFIDSGDLAKHMKIHDGNTKLQCMICQKICISQERFDDHMFKHNGKDRYQCSVCEKKCKCKSHLDEHFRIHSRERPFECPYCEVCYRYKSQLKDHILAKHSHIISNGKEQTVSERHIPPGHVECNICGTVLSRLSIRHHNLLHKGKEHSCDECEKSFISKYRLKVHKRGHTGERPYVCEVPGCAKGLTTKDGLVRHMVIHTGAKNHRCSQCGRAFYYLSNLNQHILTHSSPEASKRYTCPACFKRFTRKSMLKKHQLQPCTYIVLPRPKYTKNAEDTNVTCDSEVLLTYNLTDQYTTQTNTTQEAPTYLINNLKHKSVHLEYSVTIDSLAAPQQDMTSPENYSDSSNTNVKYQTLLGQALSAPEFPHQQQWTNEVGISSQCYSSTQNTNWLPNQKANAEVQTDRSFDYEEAASVIAQETIETNCDQTWVSRSQPQTTTFLHKVANKTVEVQHSNDIVLSEDDLSNLMTLAGVSSDTEAQQSNQSNQSDNIMFVTFGEESVKIHTNKILSQEVAAKALRNAASAEERLEQSVKSNSEVTELSINVKNEEIELCPELVDADDEPETRQEDAESTEETSATVDLKPDCIIPSVTFECLYCAKVFKYHYEIEEHCLASHPGLDVYKCFDCDATFESTRTLMKHIPLHSGNSCTQCKDCNKIFSHPQKLANHMSAHTGEKLKRFKCEHCNRRFQDSTHLRDHLMVHSGDKPFICDDCGHKFVRKRDLDTHRRIHTGEMPFKCTKCDKSFRAANYLRNHMLIHSETKPFQCMVCDKGYIKRSKLSLHMLNHTGNKPFNCKEPGCDKAYSDKREFKHHLMRHRGEKPHVCPVCSKGFTMRSNMLQHYRTHSKYNNSTPSLTAM